MGKNVVKMVFYIMAVVLFLWTASLTLAFVRRALPNEAWFVPIFALVVFDVGMLAWLMVFLRYAEGSFQRAISLALMVFDFVGVGLMVLAEVLLGGQSFTDAPEALGMYAVWGIAIWTVVNVAGVLAFHIMDPENRRRMDVAEEKEHIWEDARKHVKQLRVANSQALGVELANSLYEEVRAEIRADVEKSTNAISGKSELAQPVPVAIPSSANGHGGPVANPTQAR